LKKNKEYFKIFIHIFLNFGSFTNILNNFFFFFNKYSHWHKVLQESLNALKTILKEIDYQAFEKALANKNSSAMYLVQEPKILKKER
jgi:hypothetical protein